MGPQTHVWAEVRALPTRQTEIQPLDQGTDCNHGTSPRAQRCWTRKARSRLFPRAIRCPTASIVGLVFKGQRSSTPRRRNSPSNVILSQAAGTLNTWVIVPIVAGDYVASGRSPCLVYYSTLQRQLASIYAQCQGCWKGGTRNPHLDLVIPVGWPHAYCSVFCAPC